MRQLQAHERQYEPLHVEPTLDFARWYIARLFKTVADQQGIVLVALDGATICGFAAAFVDEEWENRSDFFYISELVVAETHRGQGIGAELMAALERSAR